MAQTWVMAPLPSEGEARMAAPMKPMTTPAVLFQVVFSPPRQNCDTSTVVIGVRPLMTPTTPLARLCSANGNSANGMA